MSTTMDGETKKIHLVLLPGMDGTGILFEFLLPLLPSFVKPLVISYPSDVPMSYHELIELVKARLPNEPFVILAESFSGPLGLRLTNESLPLLKGLILCATFAKLPGALPSPLKRMATKHIWFQIHPPLWLMKLFLAGKDASPELLQKMLQVASAVSPQVWAKRLAEVFEVDEIETFLNLKIPTLVLQPNHDFLIGSKTFPAIQSNWIKMVSVNGPHVLLQKEPETAAQEIITFLQLLLSDSSNNNINRMNSMVARSPEIHSAN